MNILFIWDEDDGEHTSRTTGTPPPVGASVSIAAREMYLSVVDREMTSGGRLECKLVVIDHEYIVENGIMSVDVYCETQERL